MMKSEDEMELDYYLAALGKKYRAFSNGCAQMDQTSSEGNLLNSDVSKRFFIDDIAYTRKQARGALNRIQRQIDGIKRFYDKKWSGQWDKKNESLINDIATRNLFPHIRFDGQFYYDLGQRIADSLIYGASNSKIFAQRDERFNSVKNYIDNVLLKQRSEHWPAKYWIIWRFAEICSVIEFNHPEIHFLPTNLEDYESILPFDAFVFGDLTLEDAKKSDEYENGFAQARASIIERPEDQLS